MKDNSSSQNPSDDKGSDDEESDSEREQKVELMAEGTENGVFLSVVPSEMEKTRETVSLIQGERIWYPSDLGYYYTCYFYVNGKIAYCIESNMASPPSSDYVADIYESNLNLQKQVEWKKGTIYTNYSIPTCTKSFRCRSRKLSQKIFIKKQDLCNIL